MDTQIRLLTYVLTSIPLILVILAGSNLTARASFGITTAVLVVVGCLIWSLFRPSAFIVDTAALTLTFPARTMRFSRDTVTNATIVDRRALRTRCGPSLRVGAGGFLGGFGFLWTRRAGWLHLYVSRTDQMVLVERSIGASLLVTPDHPQRFVDALLPAC